MVCCGEIIVETKLRYLLKINIETKPRCLFSKHQTVMQTKHIISLVLFLMCWKPEHAPSQTLVNSAVAELGLKWEMHQADTNARGQLCWPYQGQCPSVAPFWPVFAFLRLREMAEVLPAGLIAHRWSIRKNTFLFQWFNEKLNLNISWFFTFIWGNEAMGDMTSLSSDQYFTVFKTNFTFE